MNQTAPERFEPSLLQSLDSVHGRGVPSKTWNPAVQSMQSVVCTCARAVAQYSCQNKCLSTQLYSLIPIKINSQILSRSSCFGRVMIYIRITLCKFKYWFVLVTDYVHGFGHQNRLNLCNYRIICQCVLFTRFRRITYHRTKIFLSTWWIIVYLSTI